MELSIIIPNYNTKKLVEDCIGSIKRSSPKISYEIIVVDNGSTDGSVEKLRKDFGQEIIITSNRVNKGFSKACNEGLTRASGKYKLLLNSDTIVQANALDALIKFADTTKDAGVIGAQLVNKDGTIQPSCFLFPGIVRTIKEYWLGKRNILDKFYPQSEKPTTVEAVVGACFLITPRAIEKVGYLDERYFMYFEDLDYCRRVWKNGLKVYYLPASKVIHYHGASGKKETDMQNQWRRLIPSSKIYHGILRHSIITFIIWTKSKSEILFKK